MNTMTSPAALFIERLYRISEIRQIEQSAKALNPIPTLMQRAGAAAAQWALTILSPEKSGPILVLAGPGDNGGDALECAALLAQQCPHHVTEINVLLTGDQHRYSRDAQASLLHAQNAGVRLIDAALLSQCTDARCCLVIDGLFGIGLSKPIAEPFVSLIQQINRLSETYQIPVLALDIPSGLHADTGSVLRNNNGDNADPVAIRASHTLSFIANKPGLHTGDGKDFSGAVTVEPLGIDPAILPETALYLNYPNLSSSGLQRRRINTHKGNFGDVLILGGADGMQGAALLSARAALHCGAGRVHVGFLSDTVIFDPVHPELMCRNAADQTFKESVVVIGPGLGQSAQAKTLLARALEDAVTLVIDADALNLISADAQLFQQTQRRHTRNRRTLITPHPLEAARLLHRSSSEVQADRLAAAQMLAEQLQLTVILKGAGSIVTSPQHASNEATKPFTTINPSGNPALATAGTGDVLTGVCAALLAQHIQLDDAARLAVWLHGIAADRLVQNGLGPVGIAASEFIPAIRASLNSLMIGQS